MKPVKLFVLAIAASVAGLHAEVCKDVVDAYWAKRLDITLKPEFEKYYPGELVLMRLHFKNLSSTSQLNPSSGEGLFETVETLQRMKLEGNPDYFASMALMAPDGPPRPICETTLRPRVLLPGDEADVALGDLRGLREGEDEKNLFGRADPYPDLSKIQVASHSFGLQTDVNVERVDSYELLCLEYPLANRKSPDQRWQCR